ncbi:hypothetical protein Leryth_022760 [Lithospermum erythrorhizon]|nr:hypothetical protein Leryth_022760 [Lithospermum erythrorhizon]
MVFKARFFSSKKSDTSSPEGSSSSPRSWGSNSPIRLDKRSKSKSSVSKESSPVSTPTISISSISSKKKDSIFKVKESEKRLNQDVGIVSSVKPTSGIYGKVKKNDEKEGGAIGVAAAASVSPIVASSLGLNKIKTRSGPLPQESFFGFGGREKGSGLGASNLSKPFGVVGGEGGSNSSFRRKKKGSGLLDSLPNENGQGRDQSPKVQARTRLHNEESSSEIGRTNSTRGHSGGIRNSDLCTPEMKTSYDYENPKESESPRFQAILRVTSAPRKRFPGDIKSFSHELNSKGVRPFPFWKPRRSNNIEEVLTMIRARFDKAKEEVDSDLHTFAGDLVGVLDKNIEVHPEWQETIEDLLLLSRSCAMTSPGEFWLQCEGIVQDLDDKRQELPQGMLKQLHTRMLFILTRCTRLVQFHKESGLAEDDNIFQLRQSLQPPDKNIQPTIGMEEGSAARPLKVPPRKYYSQEQHGEWKNNHAVQTDKFSSSPAEHAQDVDTAGRNRMASWKKFPSPAVKSPTEDVQVKDAQLDNDMETFKLLHDRIGLPADDLVISKPSEHLPKDPQGHSSISSRHEHKVSWGHWGDQPGISDDSSIICRICEEEVPTLHVEDHSRICAISDRCDQKGLSVNDRLASIAEALERLIESQREIPHTVGSPDVVTTKVSNSSVTEESDLSPKMSDWSRRGSEDMLDCYPEVDNSAFMDELKGLPSMSCRTRFGPKSDQGMTTSSAGSMTPRSPLMTPKTTPIDMLLAGKGAPELEDIPQMTELADIARCVANTPLDDDRSLQYLLSCLEDLRLVVERRKLDALTVETFGARIEKLIREKYLQLCELVDDEKVDLRSTVIDEDAPLEDDVVRSLRTSPVHSRDRTSIDDFEIIKPISRGAFGRVFLAKKRTTGDLFAIKVLKKADMIRKNAVQSILAERDILISVRNPFVVRFFYSFTCRENLYLVMEYLNGGDMYSLLRNLGCLDEEVARVYVAEVVLALEYLHSIPVVHRDLKPDNLLIAHDGHIKLTDFGLSKVGLIDSTDDLSGPAVSATSMMTEDEPELNASQSQLDRRKKRSAVGTPDYLAPEILLGTGHGCTADWWSVGVILFELIVGIPPFNAELPQTIFDNILNRKIPWPHVPEEMSAEAQDLIDRLLTEDPNQRLGANGASEVKQHSFFKDINWDTLARQKAAFVPSSESALDTSYFTSRYSWNQSEENVYPGSDFEDSSDDGSLSGSSGCLSNRHEEVDDECRGDTTEYDPGSAINYSFSNFSFKNLSQLASINYDLLTKGQKDDQPTNP